jgi:dienelactone hydrolase
MPVYCTGSGTCCIVVGHDAFGVSSGRTKHIADVLARRLGCQVAIPTFFESGVAGGEVANEAARRFLDPSPTERWYTAPGRFLGLVWNLRAFLGGFKAANWRAVRPLLLDKVLPGLRARGAQRFGLLGFCWGGWFALHASAEPDFACTASCHPAVNACAIYSEKEQDVFDGVRCVQMHLVSARDEPKSIQPGGAAQSTWQAQPFGAGCHIEAFAQKHGWVNRGSLDDLALKRDYDRSIELLCEFYTKHLVAQGSR